MKKILLLSFSNIRKNKGQMVNLLLVVFIAAFLLNLGLLLLLNFGKFYDGLCQKTNSPHAAFLMSKPSASTAQSDYLKYYPGVTEVEEQEVLAGNADIKYNGDKMPGLFMMVKAGQKQTMNPLKLSGLSNPLTDDSIYLPYIMKAGGKLKLGGDFYISVQGKEYHYTIAGFTEEIYFGSTTIQWYRFYLSDKGYDKLKESLPSSASVLQTVRMENPELSDRLVKDFSKKFYYGAAAKNKSFYYDSSYSNVKTSRTFLSGTTSMIFVALAAVILLVSLVVIRFRIHNTLEESMVGIGVLKAMGYLSRQIMASLVIQFTGIAAVGVLLGTALSYLVLPLFSSLLESQSALIWHQGFDPVISGITLLAILSVILLDTVLTSLRIRKMHPLTALRGGITTHSFRRNSFALENSHGGLTVLLAMKNVYQNIKQTLMIFAVIAAITFAASSALSIYYNIGLHPDTFAGLVAGEIPDAVFITKNPAIMKNQADTAGVMEEIKQSEKVDKAIYYTFRSVLVNGNGIQGYVTDDFSLVRGKMLYKGRYPKHGNEVALSGTSAKQNGKTIGDTIMVNYNGKKEEYLITGLIQTMNDNGNGLVITTEGLKRLYPDFVPDQIYVYMKNAKDTQGFIDALKLEKGSLFSNTLNMNKLIDVQLGVYGSVFAIITTAITVITFFVVILVLYLVLKTAILRRRREFGIQKAVGFTSFQLMNQIALSFSPAIIAGVIAGCILGICCFNPLFVALVQNMGIMTASMPASYPFTFLLGIGIIFFSYLISLLISMRIRKITPYMLVSE